jgi:signal transduction histidine kinase
MLELFGLVAALRSHCAEFSAVTSLPAEFETNCDEPVPPEIGLCLYRIAQESLRNAARHARATRVRVSLMQSDSRLQLVVADDGAGFDWREARSRGGLGLRSMEERAWLVNGKVELASREGSGTTVTVTIELNRSSGQAKPPRALTRKAG